MRNIVFVTDAWYPQTNGVVTTISHLYEELCSSDKFHVTVIHPGLFDQFPLSNLYPDISLAIPTKLWKILDSLNFDSIHIFTEGPLGISAKQYCAVKKVKHTTSFHTNFPMLLNTMFGLPEDISWSLSALFHSSSSKVLVTNEGMKSFLTCKGFKSDSLRVWSRGVDRSDFHFKDSDFSYSRQRPKVLCVSRVSKEKNLKEFCRLSLSGEFDCVLVGDGPQLDKLKKKFPLVTFVGRVPHEELFSYYQDADVFFFPSKFDTFGVVMIESLACGTPVVALDEVAPNAVIEDGVNGFIVGKSYFTPEEAVIAATYLDRKDSYKSSLKFSWANVADIFLNTLVRR
jgi:glycosyltransferase involved in cell wall biosynthesis